MVMMHETFGFIFNCTGAGLPSRTPSPLTRSNHKRRRLPHSDLWRHVTAALLLKLNEIGGALNQALHSSESDDTLISLTRELKAYCGGLLRLFTAPGRSLPGYQILRFNPFPISNDSIFTTTKGGNREATLPRTISVDGPGEVLSAWSLSLEATISKPRDTAEDTLRTFLLRDPLARGEEYLRRHAGNLYSETTESIDPDGPRELLENFSQLLILEATNDRTLVKLVDHPRTWNFFQGRRFPDDIDTTSIGIVSLRRDADVALSVIDEMLEYVNSDGIMQTYFDHSRPRFDAVVCINALTLFYTYGCGHYLPDTLKWVHEMLLNRTYVGGTRYYTTSECFLFFLARFLCYSDDAEVHATLKPLLKDRVQELIGDPGDALALAMRILVCDFVEIRNEVDLEALLSLQCADGSWGVGWIYQLPSVGTRMGNRGLTTALAIKAIAAVGAPDLGGVGCRRFFV